MRLFTSTAERQYVADRDKEGLCLRLARGCGHNSDYNWSTTALFYYFYYFYLGRSSADHTNQHTEENNTPALIVTLVFVYVILRRAFPVIV